MKHNVNAGICPPCGENVGLPTKRGANKVNPILPLLPRLTAVLPPQGREITTQGFTLIELLVVVLIIGILAAVAVPQYQVAVKKAQLMKYVPIVRALNQAEQAYYLANGKFTTNLTELDVEIPAEGCTYYQSSEAGYYECGTDKKERYGVWGDITNAQAGDKTIRYLQFFANYDKYNMKAGDVACYSKGDVARKACRSLGPGSEQVNTSSSWDYVYTLK